MYRIFQSHVIYSIKVFLIKLQDVTHSPIARGDTQPTPRHPSSCTSTQFTWCWPFRSPHHSPHIYNPLKATVTLVLRVLFRLRIISLTLRLWLEQRPVRDGWVHCVLWVPGPRYAMCQWRSIPWEWWNTTWHIQLWNSEHSGSPDFGGSRQYSSTKARFRTSDLSVCNPDPTAHLKNKTTRPASVYGFVMTSRLECGSGWDGPLPIVCFRVFRTRTHRSSAVDNQRRALDQGPVLAWASKSGWRSHDQSKSCRGMLKRVAPEYSSV